MNTTNCLLAGALLLLCSGLSSCQDERNPTVPEQLYGVWTTGTPGYKDVFLEFTSESVIFGTGAYAADSYQIVDMKEVRLETRSLYTVSYQDIDSEEYQLSFYYHPTNGGVIRFKNQDHLIWAREEGNS